MISLWGRRREVVSCPGALDHFLMPLYKIRKLFDNFHIGSLSVSYLNKVFILLEGLQRSVCLSLSSLKEAFKRVLTSFYCKKMESLQFYLKISQGHHRKFPPSSLLEDG